MRILKPLILLLAAPLFAQGRPDHYNCNAAFARRYPNILLGFGVTWGGAKVTKSVAWGAALGVGVGTYKAIRDHRDGTDSPSVGSNFVLNLAGVFIGSAVAKHYTKPRATEFAKAAPLKPEPLPPLPSIPKELP